MRETRQKTHPVWPWLVLQAAGLLLATFVDLPLNEAVYSPQNPFAVFMESYGWCPVLLAPLGLFALMVRDGKTPLLRRGSLAGVAALLAALGYVAYGYLGKRGWLVLGRPSNLAGVAVLAFVVLWIVYFWRAPTANRPALRLYALSGIVLAAAQLVVVNLVKLVWNRARFDEMLAGEGLGLFTPWFRPFGAGGSSFPSGHTANAACLLALVVLCDALPAWNKRRGWVYALCWAYIAAMGAARVLIGRHFLSDTLAAAVMVALLLYAVRRTKPYKKALCAIQTRNKDGTT